MERRFGNLNPAALWFIPEIRALRLANPEQECLWIEVFRGAESTSSRFPASFGTRWAGEEPLRLPWPDLRECGLWERLAAAEGSYRKNARPKIWTGVGFGSELSYGWR